MTTRKAKQPTGYVIYRGPSLLDGKPIVVIAITAQSKNSKTGNLVQTYILADNNTDPVTNTKTLADESICGGCKHRRGTGGACYVNLGQGVLAVWKAYKNGNYPAVQPHKLAPMLAGRKIRLGTYGDPMAVPADYWEDLIAYADGYTGYTHQWKPGMRTDRINTLHPDQYDSIRALCMASVDNEDEWWEASYNNWRTFRVKNQADNTLLDKEFVCPASEEAGKRKTCATCMACNGAGENNARLKKATVVITVHGSLKNRFVGAAA